MKKYVLLTAFAAVLAMPAFAQTSPPPAGAPNTVAPMAAANGPRFQEMKAKRI